MDRRRCSDDDGQSSDDRKADVETETRAVADCGDDDAAAAEAVA